MSGGWLVFSFRQCSCFVCVWTWQRCGPVCILIHQGHRTSLSDADILWNGLCSTRSPKAWPWEPSQLLAVRYCFSPSHFLEVLQVLELFKASPNCDIYWISGTCMPPERWLLVGCEDVSLVRPKARKVLMLTRETKQLERQLFKGFLSVLPGIRSNKCLELSKFFFFKAKVKWNQIEPGIYHIPNIVQGTFNILSHWGMGDGIWIQVIWTPSPCSTS